jgi:hypothetical protein
VSGGGDWLTTIDISAAMTFAPICSGRLGGARKPSDGARGWYG